MHLCVCRCFNFQVSDIYILKYIYTSYLYLCMHCRHIDDCIDESWELIACPGGMPGAMNLRDSVSLRTLLTKQSDDNKLIGAICASPAVILAHHGLIGT